MGKLKMLALGIVLWCSGGAGGALAQVPLARVPDQGMLWTMSASADSEAIQSIPGQSKIVVFRLARPGLQAPPINVFVNEDFHSSLLPENRAWAVNVCPGLAEIGVSPVDRNASLTRAWARDSRSLKAGEIAFYQVDMDGSGRGVGRFVDSAQAIELVRDLPIQSHVITRTRAGIDCPAEVVRINASALFRFDRFDVSGMTNNGESVIRDLAQRIDREYASVDRVVVKGYTDPIGALDYNLRLSEQRADTVASILMESGLQQALVDSEGLGPHDLLVPNCDRRYANASMDALIACNQPNRRVEVEIFGIKANR